jgi:serine/threonine protein phosphatase 1
MSRTIAVADIHGCSDALKSILSQISPQPDDTIITLGDYVDRGLDSKGALDLLIELSRRCRLIPILGNHDEMMLKARDDGDAFRRWIEFGGITTLDSYGDTGQLGLIPDEHFEFLESCVPFFETETHVFTHANYDPTLPFDLQDSRMLRWLSLHDYQPGPHCSGKIVVVGHTPQVEILDLGHLVCIDTGCGHDGKLTALEIETGRTWVAR